MALAEKLPKGVTLGKVKKNLMDKGIIPKKDIPEKDFKAYESDEVKKARKAKKEAIIKGQITA